MTRIAVYNGSERLHGYTTGVGRHVKNLVAGLAARPDMSVDFWVPRDYWHIDQHCPPSELLGTVRSRRMPITRRWYAARVLATGRPHFEKFSDEVDWIYCPRETIVSSRSARTAVTIHDVYNFEPERRSLNPRSALIGVSWAKATAQASLVLTVSEFSKSRICEVFNIDESHVEVIGNGVEPLYFDVASLEPEVASPLSGQSYVIAVGGITRKKGGHHLLALARLMERLCPGIRLLVIGPVEQEFVGDIASCRSLQILDRGIDDQLMARYVRGSMASVMFSTYEGFGIPALEAMAAGIPVLVNSQPALMEVVGDAGLVVDAGSPGQVSDALAICDDRNLREDLAARGRARAENYRWSGLTEKLANVLILRMAPPIAMAHQASYSPVGK